jgi:hypothetical protein
MVLSFTAGSPNQKDSFESNKSNPFKRVVILVNHPVASADGLAGKIRRRYRVGKPRLLSEPDAMSGPSADVVTGRFFLLEFIVAD